MTNSLKEFIATYNTKSLEIMKGNNYPNDFEKIYPVKPPIYRTMVDYDYNKIYEYYNMKPNQQTDIEFMIYIVHILMGEPVKKSAPQEIKNISSTLRSERKKETGLTMTTSTKLIAPWGTSRMAFFKSGQSNYDIISKYIKDLRTIEFRKIVDIMTQPVDQSKQNGQTFTQFIKKTFINDCTDDLSIALNTNNTHWTWVGSDVKGAEIAEKLIGYSNKITSGYNKGIDFIARRGDIVYLGEAKDITGNGSGQKNAIRDALSIHEERHFNREKELNNNFHVISIAILDGCPDFIYEQPNVANKISEDNLVISALLLENFVNDAEML